MVQIPAEDRVRIFHAYNEADVQWEVTPDGTIHNYTSVEYWGNGLGLSLRSLPCKILLNYLTSITDEHAIEVAKIAKLFNRTCLEYIGCASDNYLSIGKYITSEITINYFDFVLSPKVLLKIFDYLRSKSYNVGYGSYSAQDLIDAGIAVYVVNKATI